MQWESKIPNLQSQFIMPIRAARIIRFISNTWSLILTGSPDIDKHTTGSTAGCTQSSGIFSCVTYDAVRLDCAPSSVFPTGNRFIAATTQSVPVVAALGAFRIARVMEVAYKFKYFSNIYSSIRIETRELYVILIPRYLCYAVNALRSCKNYL